jgi:uracil-DNA glycosylase family 4
MTDPQWTELGDQVKVTIRAPKFPPTEITIDGMKLRYEPFFEGGRERSLVHMAGVVMNLGPADANVPPSPSAALPAEDALPKGPEEQSSAMYELYEKWKGCTKCSLATPWRRGIVFGSGNDISPKILVLGEAPGPEEHVQGIPFIGPTGQLLRKSLHRVGIRPDEDCYITNSVICYPTDDGIKFRGPKGSEILTCRERLQDQFGVLLGRGTLKAVLLVGKRANITFFHREALEKGHFEQEKDLEEIKMKDVMGWHSGALPWSGIRVMTVYHPSYIMRQKLTESSTEFQGWLQDLRALSDWALKDKFWDPRPVK